MTRHKKPRTTPQIAGSRIYGKGDLAPFAGNSVVKHAQRYHVFVGLTKVLVTPDLDLALTEAAKIA